MFINLEEQFVLVHIRELGNQPFLVYG